MASDIKFKFSVNGQEIVWSENTTPTISQLLLHLKMNPDTVAVEVNQEVIYPDRWQTTMLEDGSTVMVFKFVGGG